MRTRRLLVAPLVFAGAAVHPVGASAARTPTTHAVAADTADPGRWQAERALAYQACEARMHAGERTSERPPARPIAGQAAHATTTDGIHFSVTSAMVVRSPDGAERRLAYTCRLTRDPSRTGLGAWQWVGGEVTAR